MPAVWIAIDVMPQNKGSVMGIGLCGYAVAPSIFGFIFTFMVNPQNEYPTGSPKYFGRRLSENVPAVIRNFSYIILCLSIISTLMILRNKKISLNSTSVHTLTLSQVLCHGKFWYLFFFLFFKSANYYYLMNIYKDLGFLYIDDDYFIAAIGSFGFIAGGFSRFSVGRLMDVCDWKKLILTILTVECGLCCFLVYALEISRYLYGAIVVILLALGAPSFVMAWMQTEKAYQEDKWVMSVVNIATLFDFAVVYVIESFISEQFGYKYSLNIIGGLIFLCIVIVVLKYDQYVKTKEGILLKEN